MAAAGFDGLYVNRSGYAHQPRKPEQGLVPLLGEPVVESTDGTLSVMFDLRPVRRRLARELPASDLERLRARAPSRDGGVRGGLLRGGRRRDEPMAVGNE